MNFNLNYSRSNTSQSGGGVPPASTYSQNGNMGITYRPLPNLYLFASQRIQQGENKKTQYTQGYGSTWSPFPDGDLQFNFFYNENISNINNEKDTAMSPSISWKIARNMLLNLSYALLTSDSAQGSTETDSFSMIFRLSY